MYDAVGMGIRYRPGDFRHQAGGHARRERAAGLEPCGEARPIDQPHREEMLSVVSTDIENRNDVRVIEVGCRPGLGLEPGNLGFVRESPGEDEFEGDEAIERLLPCFVDHPHAATGNLGDKFIIPDDRRGVGMIDRRPRGQKIGRRLDVPRWLRLRQWSIAHRLFLNETGRASLWGQNSPGRISVPHGTLEQLGERQDMIYLPLGLIVMSYLRSVGDRSSRASYGSISFFVSRTPFG